jgi:predicted metal-dependent HD superfamily phosphohydrolase
MRPTKSCIRLPLSFWRVNELNPLLSGVRTAARVCYEAAPRVWHNWAHVEACLEQLALVRAQCRDPQAVEWALWFHDCVYDPRRHDNEERSADMAARLLAGARLGAARIAVVRALILDTRHAAAPVARDGPWIADIDLAILGQAPEAYDAYARAIRAEYGDVPDDAFAHGRAEVLRLFLTRSTIFWTEHFRRRYESQARSNIAPELHQWAGRGS